MEDYEMESQSKLQLLLFECCKDGRLNDLIDLLKLYPKNVKKCLVECLFEGIVLKRKKNYFHILFSFFVK
jgi:hypothetical protein